MEDEYLHYRIFNNAGALNVKAKFDTADATLGRIHLTQITPPRIAANLKRTIATRESIPETASISLFLSLNDDAVKDETIGFFSERGFGIRPDDPIGLVLEGGSDPRPATPGPKSLDLTGHWSFKDTTANNLEYHGNFAFIMRSDTTFDGFGYKIQNTYPAIVYLFKMENGRVVDPTHLEWTNIASGGGWGDASSTTLAQATVSADGKTIHGVTSSYTRL